MAPHKVLLRGRTFATAHISKHHQYRQIRLHSSSVSSVNPSEISHFNKLASTWWDPHGPSRLLHQMNPLRHDFIGSCFASFPGSSQQKSYLDIGCGGGIFAESAARLPWTKSVLAIDPSKEVIDVAKLHARNDPLLMQPGRLQYDNRSIEGIPQPATPEQQHDVVSLFEVLEHVTYPSAFLTSCLPFVKPGGWLILSTIARTWTSWFTTKFIAEDVVRMVPRGTHDWKNYVNADELQEWILEKKGWGAGGGLKVMGVVYVPGFGWKAVPAGEQWGNYFLGIRRDI
ncbi:uncharacterized protein KY384_004388 [Bacidia gigantensis]|uniref:uncharacterized protein n=1 Tax=Bacidia gigantensis TaxID=2732470 RepID=UPI001D04587A|nr:uncharacterized protein KY384_004388 [Bacidia gigantensis]KAG8531031.1 hypothetical protein KY384_004388 [Bacidia gigantensis]